MPTVAIPPEHFTKNVKHNYQNHREALIREFLQNSVDAGAEEIWFNFYEGERKLIIFDDGCGMTKDVMVKALLTMSGSFKGENSIGGFGAAKEIILFQHDQYTVCTTKDDERTCVVGHQLDYEFVDADIDGRCPAENGTFIEIVFHDEYELDWFESTARSFLQYCDTKAKIMFNDREIDKHVAGELIREMEWANIYVNDISYPTNYVSVRINGVQMFREWVSETHFEVVIELTKPSLEILTVNRDGFTYQYQTQLRQLTNEISVEKSQFGKAFNEHKIWRGAKQSYDDIDIRFDDLINNMDSKFNQYDTENLAKALSKVAQATMNKMRSSLIDDRKEATEAMQSEIARAAQEENIPDQLINMMIERSNDLICDHTADFYIKVSGKIYDKIPEHLQPNKWGKRTQSWAKLWKHCIKLVMRANNINAPYTIGWVIDDDINIEAMIESQNEINVFYMNPMLTWMCSSNHMHVFHKMLMHACHEVTHMRCQYHNEDFTSCYEDMLHHTLCLINRGKNSWWKCYLASKKEVI